MPEFLHNLQEPSWWLGVVLVGLLINMASAYVKPLVDDILGKYSERRRLLNQQKKEEIDQAVTFLQNDATNTEAIRLAITRVQYTVRLYAFQITMVVLLTADFIISPVLSPYTWILFGVSTIPFLILTFFALESLQKMDYILAEYDKRREKDMPPILKKL